MSVDLSTLRAGQLVRCRVTSHGLRGSRSSPSSLAAQPGSVSGSPECFAVEVVCLSHIRAVVLPQHAFHPSLWHCGDIGGASETANQNFLFCGNSSAGPVGEDGTLVRKRRRNTSNLTNASVCDDDENTEPCNGVDSGKDSNHSGGIIPDGSGDTDTSVGGISKESNCIPAAASSFKSVVRYNIKTKVSVCLSYSLCAADKPHIFGTYIYMYLYIYMPWDYVYIYIYIYIYVHVCIYG